MRRKYIDERFGQYLAGFHMDGSVAHTNNDECAIRGTEATLKFVCERDETLLDFIHRMAEAFSEADDKAFTEFYYGKRS